MISILFCITREARISLNILAILDMNKYMFVAFLSEPIRESHKKQKKKKILVYVDTKGNQTHHTILDSFLSSTVDAANICSVFFFYFFFIFFFNIRNARAFVCCRNTKFMNHENSEWGSLCNRD